MNSSWRSSMYLPWIFYSQSVKITREILEKPFEKNNLLWMGGGTSVDLEDIEQFPICKVSHYDKKCSREIGGKYAEFHYFDESRE